MWYFYSFITSASSEDLPKKKTGLTLIILGKLSKAGSVYLKGNII